MMHLMAKFEIVSVKDNTKRQFIKRLNKFIAYHFFFIFIRKT